MENNFSYKKFGLFQTFSGWKFKILKSIYAYQFSFNLFNFELKILRAELETTIQLALLCLFPKNPNSY